MIGFGQKTYVPDGNFEQYLEDQGMGDGINGNDSVFTSNINTVTSLGFPYPITNYVNPNFFFNDLTGIEGFTALTGLNCSNHSISTLDVSQNTALIGLVCDNNQLTTLDVTQNSALTSLSCDRNQLTTLDLNGATALIRLLCRNNQLISLDVSQNFALEYLNCYNNQLTSLDVSQNTALTTLFCKDNQLTSLDVKNGNNTNFTLFTAQGNPNLTCINVDDSTWSAIHWWNNINLPSYFSNNCSVTAIQEHTTNKELLNVTDLLGRETKETNQPLFYIYDDGTVEKRIVIE